MTCSLDDPASSSVSPRDFYTFQQTNILFNYNNCSIFTPKLTKQKLIMALKYDANKEMTT